ncbi:methionyl-tRNA formyltransferase [bacterium]|nr:methionyl-tRNA formyltransferase [bacterium]
MADPKSARIVFLGTKDFAVPAFETLCDQGRNVVALITQPDKPRGRKQEIVATRIRNAAESRGILVLQPESINTEAGSASLESLRPDILVTVAYGQILKPFILAVAPFGGVNLHGSLLPKYRGAAPVARAIEKGETETGVTVIAMSPQVDAGGMLASESTQIGTDDSALTLEARLALIGAPLLAETLDGYLSGSLKPISQDATAATRAPKLAKTEAGIDWNAPAFFVDRFIRAMNPWPLARTCFEPEDGRQNSNVLILDSRLSTDPAPGGAKPGQIVEASKTRLVVACGDGGTIEPRVIQTEGRKPLPACEWARGARAVPGDSFSTKPVS